MRSRLPVVALALLIAGCSDGSGVGGRGTAPPPLMTPWRPIVPEEVPAGWQRRDRGLVGEAPPVRRWTGATLPASGELLLRYRWLGEGGPTRAALHLGRLRIALGAGRAGALEGPTDALRPRAPRTAVDLPGGERLLPRTEELVESSLGARNRLRVRLGGDGVRVTLNGVPVNATSLPLPEPCPLEVVLEAGSLELEGLAVREGGGS